MLRGADFRGAALGDSCFQEAILKDVDFQGAYLAYANLQNAEDLHIQQLAKAKTLYKAKLDFDLMEQVKEKHPHLLEEPR